MTDYTKTTDFAIKDNLPAGDSGKIIRGGEFDVEFNNLQGVSLTKADLISPIFVGTVTAPVLSVTGTATAAFFVGDGSGLTNITGTSQDLQGVTDQGSSTTNGIITGGLISTGSVGITGDLTIGSATSVSINNYALPIADGTVGQVLTTDGAGVSSWTTPSAGSASTLQQVTTAGATTTDRISVGGLLSAQSSASTNAFSAGLSAGDTNQGAAAVAVGYLAGETNQTANSVAIGNLAGNSTQGGNSVALGLQAGSSNQGAQSVAIGWLAGATNQGSNGIILNSSGLSLNEGSTGHIRIASSQGELRFTSSGGWEMIDGGTTYLNVPATGGLSVTGTTTSTAFVGDGSGLTNLPAGSTSNLQAVTDIGATTTNAITTAGLTSNGVVDVTGNIIVSGTVDGRDVNADGAKLDAIEPLADVTDTDNVVASLSSGTGINISGAGQVSNTAPDQTVVLTQGGATTVSGTYPNFTISSTDTTYTDADVDTHLNTSTATASEVLSWTGSDYDWVSVAGTTPSLQAVTDIGSSTTNSITANAFVGDGSGLTNLPASATNTLEQVTTAGNTTTNDIAFADNTKATFGAVGGDLQIYHDASASYVSDQGTGPLKLLTNSLQVRNSADNENLIVAHQDGAVTLYHNDGVRIATTNGGIDVTGQTTTDALLVQTGAITATTSSSTDFLTIQQGGTQAIITANSPDGAANLMFRTTAGGVDQNTMRLVSGGDVEFYEDTGTTAKMVWDASAEQLQLTGDLVINRSGVETKGIEWNRTGTIDAAITLDETEWLHYDNYFGNGHRFRTGAIGAEVDRVTIEPTGDVGIGIINPDNKLAVIETGAASPTALITSGDYAALFGSNTTGAAGVTQGIMLSGNGTNNRGVALLAEVQSAGNNTDFIIATSGSAAIPTEKMRVLDTGQVGIGTDSPSGLLDLTTTGTTSLDIQGGDGNSKNIVFRKTTGGAQQAKISAVGDDLRFTTGTTTERMRIDSAGIVNVVNRITIADKPVYANNDTGLSSANVYFSNGVAPVSGDGADGDIWYEY